MQDENLAVDLESVVVLVVVVVGDGSSGGYFEAKTHEIREKLHRRHSPWSVIRC